jgi:hypothetical protein
MNMHGTLQPCSETTLMPLTGFVGICSVPSVRPGGWQGLGLEAGAVWGRRGNTRLLRTESRYCCCRFPQVIGLEKALHFFWEQRIQHFFLRWPDFVRFWNVYYWVAHGSNTIGALLALFFIRPAIYQVRS